MRVQALEADATFVTGGSETSGERFKLLEPSVFPPSEEGRGAAYLGGLPGSFPD